MPKEQSSLSLQHKILLFRWPKILYVRSQSPRDPTFFVKYDSPEEKVSYSVPFSELVWVNLVKHLNGIISTYRRVFKMFYSQNVLIYT